MKQRCARDAAVHPACSPLAPHPRPASTPPRTPPPPPRRYAAYQRTTSRLLPWLPGPLLDSDEGKRILEDVLGGKANKSK